MKNRIIIAAAITVCLALCAAVWPQTEKVEKPPAPSETANVTTPRPTLPEPEELILPAITEKQESGMPEAESAPEVAAKELPIPAPEIEKQFEAEQKTAPPMQTEPAPVHPTQSESAPEPIANDNELADMVYVPGFGWIRSEGPNHVEYAEDMYENGNKIGIIVVFVGMNLMRAIRTAPTVAIPIHDSITFGAILVLFGLRFNFARTVRAVCVLRFIIHLVTVRAHLHYFHLLYYAYFLYRWYRCYRREMKRFLPP